MAALLRTVLLAIGIMGELSRFRWRRRKFVNF